MQTCSTCATVLSTDGKETLSEKWSPDQRKVACCGRIICGNCIANNVRFATYCPYCQLSSDPSPLPQDLKAPPAYEGSLPTSNRQRPPPTSCATPPPYSRTSAASGDEKAASQDALHFLDHEHDSILSLSLRYNVPPDALRRANNIASDHLLLARKTVLIPAAAVAGGGGVVVSLSPRPVGGEEEELRKNKIRRLMTSCKLADYDVAKLYLEQADYDLGAAIDAFVGDEAWEQAQPGRRQHAGNHARSSWLRFGRR